MTMEMAVLLLPECISDCVAEGVAKQTDVQMGMLQQMELNPIRKFTGLAAKVPNAISVENPWHCRNAVAVLLLKCGFYCSVTVAAAGCQAGPNMYLVKAYPFLLTSTTVQQSTVMYSLHRKKNPRCEP